MLKTTLLDGKSVCKAITKVIPENIDVTFAIKMLFREL